MIKKIWEVIKTWYNGTYVPWENEPGSYEVFIGHDHKLHWTAKLIRGFVKWYLNHWQWFWGIFIAVLTLFATIS